MLDIAQNLTVLVRVEFGKNVVIFLKKNVITIYLNDDYVHQIFNQIFKNILLLDYSISGFY
jgi:hypothetical protein